MIEPIIECIPNFSEARHPKVLEAIIESISSVSGIHLLDRHSDLDHNRTVLTFVGTPTAVEEAAFRAIAKAAELIDLDQHTGEHPRIGATDVVPFVPISGVTMQECVDIAHRLGQRVAETLNISVYLYEEAATRLERRNLEYIRRGGYETLRTEILSDPTRTPDFGPSRLGKAGATVIGARHPLIAYNVYLTTADVEIAKKVARAVRHSSGGLRYVKALGLLVDGMAQVSMNLTNFRGTPLARVVETIRREALHYGVNIDHCELVGLIPQQALLDAALWYLQLDPFDMEQILETRLASVQRSIPVDSSTGFLDALADGTATPGGGSAAAYSAAIGAALVAMVARLTIGKAKYANVQEQMQAILERAERIRAQLSEAVERDAAAFQAVMTAYKLPKETHEERLQRNQSIQGATMQAAQVPLEVAGMALEVMTLASTVVSLGNINALSDGATGAALAQAALRGAGYNVRINVSELDDTESVHSLIKELQAFEQRAAELEHIIQDSLAQRAGFQAS